MNFYVELELIVDRAGSPLDAIAFDHLIDNLLGHIVDLPEDVDLATDATRSSLTFCVSLSAASPRAAVDRTDEIAMTAMAALTESHGYTGIGATARQSELVA